MGRKERLNEVYEYVRKHFPIHTQVDFAEKLKYHRTYISSAMHGNEKNLTDKLFRNICETFPNVFNLDYLLTGEGELLMKQEQETAPIDKQQDALTYAAIQVGKMMAELSNSIASLRDFQKNLEERAANLNYMTKTFNERIAELDKLTAALRSQTTRHFDFGSMAAEPESKKKAVK
jgi:cell division protein ZapA (FtsZ GTPase activity inhibitor)